MCLQIIQAYTPPHTTTMPLVPNNPVRRLTSVEYDPGNTPQLHPTSTPHNYTRRHCTTIIPPAPRSPDRHHCVEYGPANTPTPL